jgi:hypothetical protein
MRPKQKTNLLDMIKKATEDVTGCDIFKTTRRVNHVQARNIFYKIARDNNYTFQAIGDFMGKDHASVIHGIKKFKFDADTDKSFIATYELVAGLISQIVPNNEVKPSKGIIEAYEAQNRVLLSKVLQLQTEINERPTIQKPSDIQVSLEGIPQHRIESFKENQLASFIKVERARIKQRESRDLQDKIDVSRREEFSQAFSTRNIKPIMKSHTFDYRIA